MPVRNTDFMRALRGEPTDRIPFWEVWFAVTGLDSHLMGKPVETFNDQVAFAHRMGWEYVRVPVPARSIGGRSEVASDGTTHYIQGGKVELETLLERPDPDWSAALQAASEKVHIAHEAGLVAIAYLPWAFHAVNTALGLEHFSYLLYDERAYVEALFQWVEEGARAAVERVVIPAGIDVVLFDGDCAFKNGLMVNPSVFRELVFDRTAQTVRVLRDAGLIYTLHSDGKADELLPILIELGFSSFHGVEKAANDLADIKARFGHDITLVGNMDVVFLTHATPAQIRAETQAMLRIGSQGGRYMAACNTSPMHYIPFDNYMAMVETIHSYRQSPG